MTSRPVSGRAAWPIPCWCWPPPSSRWPDRFRPGTPVVLLHLADGADALVLRTRRRARHRWRPPRPVADQVAHGAPLTLLQVLVLAGPTDPGASPAS